jgi:hypothetical protein
MAWAMAALLQGALPLLSGFHPFGETAVESAAIKLSEHRLEICVHHSQGCPATCHCPKTGFVETSPSRTDDGKTSGRLGETSWAQCSESRAVSAPAVAVYLPAQRPRVFVPANAEPLTAPAPAFASTFSPRPPPKIPIV